MTMHNGTANEIQKSVATSLESRLQEAARYALLRRLTPALRHHMVGALQPLGMLAAMLERRAQAAAPDLASIQKKSSEMGQLSREATASCIDLVNWIAPKGDDLVSIAGGVKECLSVLETDLALRGFVVANETGDVTPNAAADTTGQVRRAVMRNVYAAALLALTDAAPEAAEVVLQSSHEGGAQVVTISLRTRAGEGMGMGGPAYRALEWADVQALADAEGVKLEHSAERVSIRIAA
jgi:hypothetical protein